MATIATRCAFTQPLRESGPWLAFRTNMESMQADSVLWAAEQWLDEHGTAADMDACATFVGAEYRELARQGYGFRLRNGVELTVRGSWDVDGYGATAVRVTLPRAAAPTLLRGRKPSGCQPGEPYCPACIDEIMEARP